MPLDLSEEYNLVKKKVESTKKYKEIKKDIEQSIEIGNRNFIETIKKNVA